MAKLTYKEAGVDIDAGEELVERIKAPVKRTNRPEVIGGLGGFGALTRIPEGYRKPVLVTGTDGVGTKLRLAIDYNRHSTVGQDLATVVTGIAYGCELAGCALVGGETAEMPGMYSEGDYDLAGFAVGVVDEDKIIDGSKVKVGDALVGLASSGPHSNGFSLIRAILKETGTDPATARLPSGKNLLDALIEPTRIYVKSVLKLLKDCDGVHALAHITGGGFWDNIPRVLPDGACATINAGSWKRPEVFDWLEKAGGVDRHEMYRTFNNGVGMVIAVAKDQAEKAIESLKASGENAWLLGEITEARKGEPQVVVNW